jgi:hypothetical protein
MYEIWLMLNIVWEIALGAMPWLLAAAAVWAVLVVLAARHRASSSAAGPAPAAARPALAVGLGAAVLALFAVPALTQSSLGEATYLADWLALGGIALAAGVAAFLFAWPALRLLRSGGRP